MFKNMFSTVKKINAVLTRPQKKSIAVLLWLMLVSSVTEAFGISLIIPYFAVLTDPQTFLAGTLGTVISRVLSVSDQNGILIFLTAALIVAFGLKYLLSYVIKLKQTNFVNKNRFLMAQRVMRSLIREDYESYLYRNMAEEINLVTTHVTWTFELIRSGLSMMVQVLNVLLLSALMLAVDVKITVLFGVGIFLLYGAFLKIFRKKVKLAGEEANRTWEAYEKTICEAFSLKKENDVFRRNDGVFDGFTVFGTRNVKADEKKIKYGMIPGLVTNLISVWAILFFVLFALASGGNVVGSLGKLSAFYLAATQIIPGVNSIHSNMQSIAFYTPSLDRVNALLKLFDKSEYTKTLDRVSYPMRRTMRLNNVSFRYQNASENVLEDVCLEIRQGERIGIVGKTGSGKTTLVNLIIGLLRPESGEIRIDDLSPSTEGILDVGYVPQDTNLLDASIRENITFGRTATEDEVRFAVKAAGLQEFTEQLPDGLETQIGERGVRLSGGQRQRIGIARALIGAPSVLIFDESTSSLDLQTEQAVLQTVQTFERDKTVLMISHRPNTLQFCDRWLQIEGGKLTELSACP